MPLRRNIDIDLLRTFVSIVETGSFTQSAQRLLRTQSAVSLQVKRLEDALGINAFERGHKPVSITADGELLLAHAQRVLAANDAMVAQLLEPEVRGMVRIGVSDYFAALQLTSLAARFVRAYPQTSLQISCDVDAALAPRFARQEFDLMFSQALVQPAGTAAVGASTGTEVWREPLVWLGREQPVRFGVTPLPLVLTPSGSVERTAATAALDGCGRAWRISYSTHSSQGLQAAVAAGLGFAALPRSAIETYNGHGAPRPTRFLGSDSGLPTLPEIQVHMHRAVDANFAAQRLGDFIASALVGCDAHEAVDVNER